MFLLFCSLQNFLDLPRKNISFNHGFISMNNFKETFWHFLSHNTGFWLVKHNVTLASNKFALPKLTSSTFQSFPCKNNEKGIRKYCKMPNKRIISGVTRHFSSRSTIQTIVWFLLFFNFFFILFQTESLSPHLFVLWYFGLRTVTMLRHYCSETCVQRNSVLTISESEWWYSCHTTCC